MSRLRLVVMSSVIGTALVISIFIVANPLCSAPVHAKMLIETAETGDAFRDRLTEELRDRQIFLLHASKTGGSSSRSFAQECVNKRMVNNCRDPQVGLEILRNLGLLASHLGTNQHRWSGILREKTEELVVLVPVRPFSSWYPSAVMQVASKHCAKGRPSCHLKKSSRRSACFITRKMLKRITEKRYHEISDHVGRFFTGAAELKRQGNLRSKIFLVDMDRLDVVYDVISRRLCPNITAKRTNEASAKQRMFLDEGRRGSCSELSANASRSHVNLLSLDSRPFSGWLNDSIPQAVYEAGLWEYA